MALVRWSPVGQLAGMEIDRLNRMFSDLYQESFGSNGWVPAVDVFETEGRELVIKADLPEMSREAIGVTFENNVLTLKGERTSEQQAGKDRYQRIERRHGSFSRSFTLPATVDASLISATYKDGVLTVRLPQREEAKAKQIVINAD